MRVDGTELSHGQLDRKAASVSAWLANRIEPGDRVMLAGPASLDWVCCYLGTLHAGGVAVLANPAYTETELAQLVEASGATLALAWNDTAQRLLAVPGRPAMVVGGDAQDPASRPVHEVLAHPPEPWVRRGDSGATALLAFTSGTTGRPKGVPLTHRQLLTSIRSAMAAWRWSAEDVLVHSLPLFHQHGLGGVHATVIAGSSLNVLSHFSPDDMMTALLTTHATVLFAVPTMYRRLKTSDTGRWSPPPRRLRLCVSGSAPLSNEVAAGAAQVLGHVPLVRYGATETGLDTSHAYSDPPDIGLAETIGSHCRACRFGWRWKVKKRWVLVSMGRSKCGDHKCSAVTGTMAQPPLPHSLPTDGSGRAISGTWTGPPDTS